MDRISIIGAGLAGLSTAIRLAELGLSCRLISLQASERAQSILAEGGINGVLDTMGEGDSLDEHFRDSFRGGAELADPGALRGLVEAAPAILAWLEKLGVPFARKNGKLQQRKFGGQKKKRTAFARSSTGKVLMTALLDEARKYEARERIQRLPRHEALSLVRDGEGKVLGVKLLDLYTRELFFCPGPLVLAMGGLNGFFPGRTTGSCANSGNFAAELFAGGLAFANLEFIQYHPTTVAIPGKRLLLSEAARAEGGRLYILRGGKPWYFLEERYPEMKNLMPRDVVAREMLLAKARGDTEGEVLLDMREIPENVWQTGLSDMRAEILEYLDLDLKTEPLAVAPGIHFFMGGISVNARHETSLPGLYAVGECASQYHGANRLGGNSLLAAIYSGRLLAEGLAAETEGSSTAAGEGKRAETAILSLGRLPAEEEAALSRIPRGAREMGEILFSGLGMARDEKSLRQALEQLTSWERKGRSDLEKKRALLGRAMLLSALGRRESRGAHLRLDYPERDERNFQKKSRIRLTEGGILCDWTELSGGGPLR